MRRLLVTVVALLGVAGCHVPPLPDDLQRGQKLEAAQKDEEALALYRQATARCRYPGARPHDDCGLLAFRQAQTLERLGRYEEARTAFLATRDLTLDGRLAARALVRAALLESEQLGRRDEALKLCRLVVKRWPDEVPAEDALQLLIRLRQDQPAGSGPSLGAELDQLATDLSTHEVSGLALFRRAELADQDGEWQLAVARYDELWRRFPRGPLRDDAAYQAALILRKNGQPAQAAERLARLERTFMSSMLVGHYNKLLLDDAAILQGQIDLDDLHQPEQAIRALKGLLKRQPTSLLCDDALLLMARAALSRHEPPTAADRAEACDDLQTLRVRYPDGNMVRRGAREEARLGCVSVAQKQK